MYAPQVALNIGLVVAVNRLHNVDRDGRVGLDTEHTQQVGPWHDFKVKHSHNEHHFPSGDSPLVEKFVAALYQAKGALELDGRGGVEFDLFRLGDETLHELAQFEELAHHCHGLLRLWTGLSPQLVG